LIDTKIAIFKENYPEDKLTEEELDHILEELERVLHGTPKGELPHLKSFRLEASALMYVCAHQQSGQWLTRAIDNHRLRSGARLKVTDAGSLPKPIKVALRTRDNIAKSPEELLKWVKDLNPGLHVEHWRVLVRQPEPKGQRLILLIDRDSLTAIKGTGYKIFMGLTQGTVKVLRDPEAGPQKEQVTATSPESMEPGSGGEGAARPPSPGTGTTERSRGMETIKEVSSIIKSVPADRRASSEETQSAERTDEIDEGMVSDPPLTQAKE
jgi:hypothetical protein